MVINLFRFCFPATWLSSLTRLSCANTHLMATCKNKTDDTDKTSLPFILKYVEMDQFRISRLQSMRSPYIISSVCFEEIDQFGMLDFSSPKSSLSAKIDQSWSRNFLDHPHFQCSLSDLLWTQADANKNEKMDQFASPNEVEQSFGISNFSGAGD